MTTPPMRPQIDKMHIASVALRLERAVLVSSDQIWQRKLLLMFK